MYQDNIKNIIIESLRIYNGEKYTKIIENFEFRLPFKTSKEIYYHDIYYICIVENGEIILNSNLITIRLLTLGAEEIWKIENDTPLKYETDYYLIQSIIRDKNINSILQ